MVLKAIDENSLRLIPVSPGVIWVTPNPPVNIRNSHAGRSIPGRIFAGLISLFERVFMVSRLHVKYPAKTAEMT
jgi:hypothetical protein